MRGSRRRLHRRLAFSLVIASILALGAGGPVLGEDEGEIIQPVDFSHTVLDAPAPVAGAVFGTGPALKPGQRICTTQTQTGANVNTDCERTAGPHNETSIAINPTDELNLIGGANDYQLGLNRGGHVTETVLSRAHVTFDGGQTWSEYPINFNSAYQATGDPAVAFDAAGHAPRGQLSRWRADLGVRARGDREWQLR